MVSPILQSLPLLLPLVTLDLKPFTSFSDLFFSFRYKPIIKMSSSSSPQIHASVLQFLMDHGYMESVEAFKREARRHLDTLTSHQVSQDQLVNDLSQLQIQR
jgi:hypothetical protein